MTIIGWYSRLFKGQPPCAGIRLVAGGAFALLLTAGIAVAQNTPDSAIPTAETHITVPDGYSIHQAIDLGGRIANIDGSDAMYNTLVNLHSGPRVLGETFELRALPGVKTTWVDNVSAFGSGFGGDPNNFARLNASKGKYYEFSGVFRRDRQYFDYDLLGNPGIPTGYSIPIGSSTAPSGSYAWPQVNQSPFLFNTVRRMTDTNLTILPVSRVTYRFAYSKNVMQGPTRSPSGNSVAGQEVLLEEYQRNNTDDFFGAVDWKPVDRTKLTFEEQIDHYKGDSYFTLDPAFMTVQEPDGTRVQLLDTYHQFVPYGYSTSTGKFSPGANCNASSLINSSTIFYPNPAGGPPIIDPACNVISSYFRSQPTRAIFPTEIFRFQSTSIKNISMNGNVRYTHANSSLPNFYDSFQGLSGTIRSIVFTATASTKREVMAADYGIVWQASKTVSIEDQINYSNIRQPGSNVFTGGTDLVIAGATNQTINNPTLSTCVFSNGNTPTCNPAVTKKPSAPLPTGSNPFGTPFPAYFGQRTTTNNATVTWDANPRSTFSFTWRYQNYRIAESQGDESHSEPIPANNTDSGVVTIHQNGGIFVAAVRPSQNWDLNGSIEAIYNDNAFTPMGFRQLRHYRVHTLYRPRTWATVSGAFNDMESHNNTNNNQNFPGNTTPYYGPLKHEAHSRVVSLGTQLFPNERYGVDFDYTYSDVYMADNICFQGGAVLMPGGTNAPGPATPSGALCGAVAAGHGANTTLFGPAKDFMSAPTQFGSVAVTWVPNKKFHSNAGYRISSVNGSRFFTDASDVNGAMVSAYQTPFVSASWTVHPGLIWKGEYDYFGYGEGGRSGAEWCNNNPGLAIGTTTAPVVACSSVPNTAMSTAPIFGFTAPRNFHANNVTLGVHYEF